MKITPILLAVLLVPAACRQSDELNGPPASDDPRMGVWEAVEVDGMPVPFIIDESSNCVAQNLGGSIALRDDGAYSAHLRRIRRSCSVGPQQTSHIVTGGWYEVRDDSIYFRPSSQGSGPFAGAFAGASLRVDHETGDYLLEK